MNGLPTSDVLFEKIERLTKVELTHNYKSELSEIRQFIYSEDCKKRELVEREVSKLTSEIDTLKIVNKALAKLIKDSGLL